MVNQHSFLTGKLRFIGCSRDRFAQVRDRFKLDDRIGLSSLSDSHGKFCSASLVEVCSAEGKLCYTAYFGFIFVPVFLLEDEKARIVVNPDISKQNARLISIHQKKRVDPEGAFEDRILDVDDLVLDGLVAHELAHWLSDFGQLPESIKGILLRIHKDKVDQYYSDSFYSKAAARNPPVAIPDEAEIDVIASLHGFRDAVLAKIKYVIDCLKSYEGMAWASDSDLIENSLDDLEFRKKQVEKYG